MLNETLQAKSTCGESAEAGDDGYRHEELTRKIIGGFYEVYNELGCGFLESVYEQAMIIALRNHRLTVQPQAPIFVSFRGEIVGEFFADLLVNDAVIVELKAARAIEPIFEAQLLNYLHPRKSKSGC